MNDFYVYHHINENLEISDGGCRYIGKGKKYRAMSKHDRNQYWHHIFTKDNPPTIVLIAENLTEEEAFAIEIQQIAFAKEHGIKLCNITEGGEGVSGLKASPETKKKMSEVHTGFRHTEESKKKMIENHWRKKSEAKNNPKWKASPETKKKMSEVHTGFRHTEESKKKMSEVYWQKHQ